MEWFWTAYDWVYDWQTLVSALLALIAALATIAVMQVQIKAEAKRHREALKRKAMAARAQMP